MAPGLPLNALGLLRHATRGTLCSYMSTMVHVCPIMAHDQDPPMKPQPMTPGCPREPSSTMTEGEISRGIMDRAG